MYKAIIADDEQVVKNGLKKFIEWEKYGFTIVGTASGGNEAMELVRTIHPDLVITDIYMSNGDGLSLIDSIRAADMNTEIIIITGYEDFNIAKQAIKASVVNILLKPINKTELIQTLEKAAVRLGALQKNPERIISSRTDFNNVLFFHSLLDLEEPTESAVKSICEKYNVSLPSTKFLIGLIHIDYSGPSEKESDSDYILLYEIINKICMSNEHFVLADALIRKNMPIIVFERPQIGPGGINSLLSQIKDEFSDITGLTVTIGISLIFKNITQIKKAYAQALAALNHMPNYGRDCIIDYRYLPSQHTEVSLKLTNEELQSVCDSVKQLDRDAALKITDDYFDRVSTAAHLDTDEIRDSVLTLAILIIHDSMFDMVAINSVFGRTLNPSIELQRCSLVSELHSWLSEFIETLTTRADALLEKRYSSIVNKAIIYTMVNYAEPITATIVANKLYISPNHFMRTFKKEVGKTYGEYLTDYRIMMATRFLKTDLYKINEVGKMVGYPNSKYFSRIFKKLTGHNPGYYCSTDHE